jgi:hypothetical protein
MGLVPECAMFARISPWSYISPQSHAALPVWGRDAPGFRTPRPLQIHAVVDEDGQVSAPTQACIPPRGPGA